MAKLGPLDEILSAVDDPLDEILHAPTQAPGGGGASTLPTAASSAAEPGATSPAIPPQFGGNIVELIKWAAQNPQMALDLAGQTAGTGLGIAGGTATLGPVGGIAGGAGGNVLGKQVAREVGGFLGFEGSEKPDLMSTETAIDAGLGGLGPVVGSTARGVTRLATGMGRKGVAEAEKGGERAIKHWQGEEKAAGEALAAKQASADFVKKHYNAGPEMSAQIDAAFAPQVKKVEWVRDRVREATKAAEGRKAEHVDLAVQAALKKAQGRKITADALPAGVGALLIPFEPLTGALLGAGLSHAVLSKALPKILSTPGLNTKFAEWALNVSKNKPKDIAKSFAALAAEAGIDLDMKEDASPRESTRPKPLRDETTGQFKSSKDVTFPLEEIIRGDR